ncbi:SGNH/GDSL hydrolase family protein [Nocardioides solisilvae]|uniref:SGNH/GDSL hydrolase family protein n=1 Tax=Nocardioides solisilvae TaxID=1542435 RepID=UPI000D74C33F|nr:SGNH/GDSL hydrolase family protein [Nocardioides solisilvae]
MLLAVLVAAGAWGVTAMSDERAPTGAAEGSATLREVLEPWYDAVRRHDEAPARVVVVGDSISEGVWMPTPVHRNRMVGMLQEELRERLDAPGAAGYLPAFYVDPATRDDTSQSGAPAQEYMFEKWGLGGRALFMPPTATLTYPRLPARRVRVWYGAVEALGGEGRVLVDGEDVTSAGTLSDGTPSPATLSSVAARPEAGLWWESPDLGQGDHLVQVVGAGPLGAFVHTGVEFLDPDASSGIHVYDGSHSGAGTQHYASELMAQGHWREVAALDPQLVLVNLGSNPDFAYAQNLRIVVERALEAAPDAAVVLVDGYEPGNWQSEAWQEVRAARREVAAAHPDRVAVFDLAAQWPVLAKDGSTNEGLMIEEMLPLHPSLAGNERMAEIFADLLTPPD